MVFMVRNVTLQGCASIVEGKGGWIMLLVVHPAHTNIPLATATQCCLFWCDFQPWLMLPLLVPRMVACRTNIGKSREDDEVTMCLRASFTSPKILLMTVLSQGIGSLNPFQNLKPSLPQRASTCNCSRLGARLESASIPQLLMPLTGSEDLQNMLKSPRREVVRSSAGAGVIYPPFLGSFA